jgi:hypothetical protein
VPTFSDKSAEKLATCHPDLQRLFNEVIKSVDCTVLEGHRGKERQEEAYKNGYSKTPWPESKHNSIPSRACDVVKYPVDFKSADARDYYFLAGYVLSTAERLGIKIRWGGDWDSDRNLKNQKFYDLPHFELC